MTNQKLTFVTLDSYFLNTGNMRLNIGYFRDSVRDQLDIVQRHTNGGNGKSMLLVNLENSRRSIRSIVWNAFISMTNDYILNETGNEKMTCTGQQLKKYLAQYGYTVEEALQPVIEEVSKWRNSVKAGEAV